MTSSPEQEQWTGFEVAIVGMAGRFPGARDTGQLWENLRGGVESVRFPTDEELLAAGEDPARLREPNYVRATTVLEGLDEFDAEYFGVTPREAETMDPQHRLFLETASSALEAAGYDPARAPGAIGVYGGSSTNTYFQNNLLRNAAIDPSSLPTLFGNGTDYLTTRVSYKLDLTGPSLDVQTGCSSSLVAVHLAAQALLSGECDLALAGGVSITVPHGRGYLFREQGIYSPDGHCRAFSANAQGTVGGSGVAVVALRRLQDALDDGDHIHAVIKGSSINNDGSGKVGYAAPGVEGQAAVIRNALAMGDVHPDSLSYVEAHGTGTALGDPIEIAALTTAWREQTDRKEYCAIGSIKTNIGHLDAAAGVTGLIKVALALEHRELPPSLNCDEPDPAIDFPSTPFRVQTALSEWKSEGQRRAAVSSFGIGGTNAHVIVEEAPEPVSEPQPSEPAADHLLVLSARTPAALDRATEQLAQHLRSQPNGALADIANTLQVGRREFDHRRAVAGSDTDDLAQALEDVDRGRVRTSHQEPVDRSVVFLFPGQGAQYVRMGAELYEREPVFRECVDRACELLEPHLGLDLREVLYPEAERAEAAEVQLGQTALTQPALFVVEYALARVFMAWGIRPSAMIGHSIGEYVAATLAGVFSLEDALALVAARGRLMQDLPAGAMLAVPLPAAEVEPHLGSELSVAAINESSSCVVSGPMEAVDALEGELRGRRVASRRLHTSHAFHSVMMDPILDAFTERVRAVGCKSPEMPFVSTLTGTWIQGEEATDPAYWARHLRQTVQFAAGVEELLSDPRRVLLEVGPGNTLTTLATRVRRGMPPGPEAAPVLVSSMRHPRESQPDGAFLLGALGQLWCARVAIDWNALHGDSERRRVPLPTYPFERQRFWIEPDADGGRAPVRDLGKSHDVADWFWLPSWKRSVQAATRATTAPEQVLVLEDGGDLAAGVVRELRSRGANVSVVSVASAFEARGDGRFGLDPGRAEHFQELVAALEEQRCVPGQVIHLWSAEPGSPAGADTDLDRGFFSLLFFAQAVLGREWSEPIDLAVVTRDLHDVTGEEALGSERAALLGACLSIGQECASLHCRNIDLAASDDNVALLLGELTADAAEPVVAWRGRHRWTQSLEQVLVPAEQSPSEPDQPVREGAHVLITGGLGSIGLEVAACLARTARARLVLTGRSEFPARDAWPDWLASHDADDETSMRITKLGELEALGAEVQIERADATDLESMEAAVRRAEERFGPLQGVVHAAGADKSMVLFGETTREQCLAQFAPKLAGLRALEQLLESRDVDFCVVQSSLASLLGALGMIGYVAAHHIVDAFVTRHNQTHRQPWTSANWDNWLSWKEAEFAHAAGSDAFFMTPEEGAEAFLRVLGLPAGTQVAVSTGDLQARLDRWVGTSASEPEEPTGAEPNLHARPDLQSDYEAPSSPEEEVFVAAWGDVLGIGEIGVHDSFFELGGDSVLGLQVVAKVAQAGLRITPAQIFEHPTISGLAAVAEAQHAVGTAGGAEQGQVTGEAPLLPIQHWFFEQEFPDPQHFNLPMLFEVPAGTEPELLEHALRDVALHHDALRMRYSSPAAGRVVQAHAADGSSVPVTVVDLASTPESERDAAMEAHATELHKSLDLDRGPLMRAVLFRHDADGAGRPSQVLWIIHHLLVDVVSWRTLLEDLQSALRSRSAGERVSLPAKTTSFKRWAELLAEYARSDAAGGELEHWRSVARTPVAPLPTDKDSGPNVFGSTQTVAVALDEERTRALLQEVPKAYETRIDEVLLTALALASARSGSGDALLVDLEGHGREGVVEGADLSRTVGWLTTLYPALFDLGGKHEPKDALMAVKEQVRAIPHHGIGFGILRFLSEDESIQGELRGLPRPELSLLYLGQFGSHEKSSQMRLLQKVSGPPCSPDAPRGHLLEIVAFVAGGRLQVEFSTSANRHELITTEALAQAFLRELEALITHCLDPEAGARTPSDFPAARVSQSDLNKLMSKIGRPDRGASE